MVEITYLGMVIFITLVWLAVRAYWALEKGHIDWKHEAMQIMVYICLIVIARMVYFPWHHVNGHIGYLTFDASRIVPFRLNLVPIVHLFETYDGWLRNIIGNAAMYIPVGIVWPACYKKLSTVGKTVLAGAAFSLLIEISQLAFFDRYTDIDDLILNTTGVLIGALIFFGIRALVRRAKASKADAV